MRPLDLEPVLHQLAEEVARPEDVAIVGGGLEGAVVLADLQPAVHLAARAAGRRDEALGVALEQLVVEAGVLPVLPFEAGAAREPEEVVQALGRLARAGSCGCS